MNKSTKLKKYFNKERKILFIMDYYSFFCVDTKNFE